jgi:hypothetical protein
MDKFKTAQLIAVVASVLSVIGWGFGDQLGSAQDYILMLAIILSVVSYFFAGFVQAIKMSGKIAKWGWFVVPFPIDLVTGLLAFVFAILAFLFVPIIPVRKAYKESISF